MLAFPEMLKPSVKKTIAGERSTGKKILEKLFELISIIVSIYLALSIEGWSEKRSEHKKMLYYYNNLAAEIALDTASLDSALMNAEKHLRVTRVQLGMLRKYEPSMDDSLLSMYRGLAFNMLFYTSSMLSYNTMVVSGDIKLIENIKVRNKLAELNEVYTGLRLHEDMYLKYIQDDIMKSFMSNFDLIDQKIVTPGYYKSLFYRNLVAGFYVQNAGRVEQYRSSLKVAKETLALIKEELEKEEK
ncbi:MAG TPA: DUF6090 family protein [Bacteroidales bacterium]|nr:DUF6090 family protein [Bacteroidales bacterium]